jgi:cytoskeletal protein CcmA (bactofilin family)
MAFRRPKDEGGDRWLEMDASMTGTLTFKDPVNLQINGRFEGTLDTKGNLSIGEKAEVKATIRGEAITIAGTVNGDVTASSRVELLPSARVVGRITR